MLNPIPTDLPANADGLHIPAELDASLRARQPWISPKFLYDPLGSKLFEAICELPEYYPTRTELGILRDRAAEIVRRVGPHAELVEFGAGSLEKIRVLLDAFAGNYANAPARYVPVDISADYLHDAAARLRAAYPWLDVAPIAADYTKAEQLAAQASTAAREQAQGAEELAAAVEEIAALADELQNVGS